MTFGDAIEAMKKGKRVYRPLWAGNCVYLLKFGDEASFTPVFVLHTNGINQPGWAPNQFDMIAEDWEVFG